VPENHVVRVEFPAARQLADAAAVFRDLGFVIDTIDRLGEVLTVAERDSVLVEAYWTPALVAYFRRFASGKRAPLTEAVFEGIRGADRPAVDVHRFFKTVRDKHVAHSVNPFEQVKVGLVLSLRDESDHRVEGVATRAMRLIAHDVEGLDSLRTLATIAREAVAAECKRLTEVTLQRALAGTRLGSAPRRPA
jgi:hypothetical protein